MFQYISLCGIILYLGGVFEEFQNDVVQNYTINYWNNFADFQVVFFFKNVAITVIEFFFCIHSKHFFRNMPQCLTDWSLWNSNTASSCSSCCHSNHFLWGWWWPPSPTIAPKTKSREATSQLEICQRLWGKDLLLPHSHNVCMLNDDI